METLFNGIRLIILWVLSILVLIVLGVIGVIGLAFSYLIPFALMGVAVIVSIWYFIWEAFNKPKDTEHNKNG